MANKSVKLKNKRGDYLYPYTDNIPTGNASVAGKVIVDAAPTSGSANAVSSGGVYSALAGKLGTNDTAAKATADAEGNNIATTYMKKSEEGKGGLNLLVSQLQRAHAWTWSNTLSTGVLQALMGAKLSPALTCSSWYFAGYSANNLIVDGKLYTINATAGTATQFGTDTNYKQYYYNVAIKNNGIYYAGNINYAKWIDQSGTYTKIGNGCGIKNGTFVAFGTQSNTNAAVPWTVIDNAGVWTDIIFSWSNAAIGIRDGCLYKITWSLISGAYQRSGLYQISPRTDFTRFGYYSSTYVYAFKGTELVTWAVGNLSTSNPDPYRTITIPGEIRKVCGQYVLLTDGKLYSVNSGYSISLFAEDVLDVGKQGYLKSDGFYNTSKTLIQEGTFTELNEYGIFTGAGTVQQETFFTVPSPAANYQAFRRVDLYDPVTVTAATTTTITCNSKTYTRNTYKDSTFTQPPDDLKKQTPTKWQLIEMVQNLE